MGRTPSKAFEHINTFQELIEDVKENMKYLTSGYFHEKGVEVAVKALTEMDEQQQKQTLRYMKLVDRKLTMGGAANGNRFHKIPTLLAGCIYIAYHQDQIKDLNLDELSILSRFSIVEPPEFYETAVDYLGHELLTVVADKHYDFMFQSGYMNYAESKIRNGTPKEVVTQEIKETPVQELSEKVFEWERELIQEAGKYL